MAGIESKLHYSEDEYNLINEVDILCVKIEKAAIKFDAEMDKAIRTSIGAHENREVRIKKWRTRLANLQKFLAALEAWSRRILEDHLVRLSSQPLAPLAPLQRRKFTERIKGLP